MRMREGIAEYLLNVTRAYLGDTSSLTAQLNGNGTVTPGSLLVTLKEKHTSSSPPHLLHCLGLARENRPPSTPSQIGPSSTLHLNGKAPTQQVIEWHLPPKPMTVGPQQALSHPEEVSAVSLDLNLSLISSHSSGTVLIPPRPSASQVNPNFAPSPLPTQCIPASQPTQMAFQRADPGPFLLPEMQLQHIDNRQFMVRAVAGSRPVPRHEDWAIVTIQPLPGNVLNFDAVRDILDDFFADVARVQICSIQRSHLGQALV